MLVRLPNIVCKAGTGSKAGLAFMCGAVSTLALPPFFMWPVLFLTFTTFVWILDGAAFAHRTPILRRVSIFAVLGWAFGFGYFLAGVHWVGYSFLSNPTSYPVLTKIGMVIAVLALTAGLGLFYGVASAICAVLWRPGYARLAAFAFAFFLAEFGRSTILTGFPWNLFGLALTSDDASMQAASIVGVNGLTLAALLVFPVPASLIGIQKAQPTKAFAPLLFATAILLAIYGFGFLRLNAANTAQTNIRVRIVQPNIAQRDKYVATNQGPIFEKLLNLSRFGSTGEDISAFDYVIWPESSVPFLFSVNDGILYPNVKDRLSGLIPSRTRLVMGAERAAGTAGSDGVVKFEQIFNSLFVIQTGAAITDIYDKVHLVPFGEYLPLAGVLRALNIHALSHRLDSFTPGAIEGKIISAKPSDSFAPLICYEVIFPGSIASGTSRPSWIVNVTNDAWFGASTGPYQHFHLARLRAVEEGIPLVRAANTGISAIVNAYGNVVANLRLNVSGSLDGYIPVQMAQTVYSKRRLMFNIVFLLFPLQSYLLNVLRHLP